MANKSRKLGSGGPASPRRPTPPPGRPLQVPSEPQNKASGQSLCTPFFDALLDASLSSDEVTQLHQQVSLRVPMEFRAQAKWRCKRQFIVNDKDRYAGQDSDLLKWRDEWIERVDPLSPFSEHGLHVIEVRIDWRLISNSGVDEGFIRPVIGAGGWPLIPGSGIKGLFRRACPPERRQRWCGSDSGDGDLKPGILRFHGAWPADASWTQGLLDLAHPQQNWQVGFNHGQQLNKQNKHQAFSLVSLYQPCLRIGLSCIDPSFSPADWDAVDATLRKALQAGIGGRTAAGYGSCGRMSDAIVFDCGIRGQGTMAKLLDKTPEFRPTMFRAAIRGMALRLFGGLTDGPRAIAAVDQLFGSISSGKEASVGLLSTAYVDAVTQAGSYGSGKWEQDTYATQGRLQWRLARGCRREEDEELLKQLLACLHGIVIGLAGFGRGWRRPDHQLFFPGYPKGPIGCHWEWSEPERQDPSLRIQSADDLSRLLKQATSIGRRWLQTTGVAQVPQIAPWREVIHPDRMKIWWRIASDPDDAEVVHWFHNPKDGESRSDVRDLKNSDIAGTMNQVGLIWNRLLPLSANTSTVIASGAAIPTPRSVPAQPFARPGAATARPGTGAMRRSSSQRQNSRPKGAVSISHSNGPFLETVVLFPDQQITAQFERKMDQGAGADFARLQW